MPSNAGAAEAFREIADLLDVLGERFKPEAYRRAARSIETLTEELAAVAARDELRSIPGVGDAIAEKIREYLATGAIPYLERLQHDVPAGVVAMMRLPGLGPKTARRFWVDLGIDGPSALAAAIDAGRLDGVKGFGPKKIAQVRSAVESARTAPATGPGRTPIEEVYPVAERIVRALRARAPADRVEAAGSFRRRRETVGDLDVLVSSTEPEAVFDAFSALPEVREVRLRGGTKETVVLSSGLQVDLRVVEPAAFGAALQYFTGSKDHNVHLRSIARDRGLKVNEYGVYRGDERVAGRTEEDVYAALGLAWVPPEVREDQGEVEAAARGRAFPRLVDDPDLTGDLHVHLPEAADAADVDRVRAVARARGVTSLGVVVGGVRTDGSTFVLAAGARARLDAREARSAGVWRAVETGPAGVPPPLRGLEHDYRIVRPTQDAPDPAPLAPGAPVPLVAHLGGAGAEGVGRVRRWVEWAREVGAAVEVGPGPERLDATWARLARASRVPLALPRGLTGPADDPTAPIALGFARRAGAEPQDVRVAPGERRVTRPRPTGSP